MTSASGGRTAATTTTGSDAFVGLISPLLSAAYGTAFHLTRNREDAEDLLQEASLNAYRGFAGYTPGTNFRAWFFRIMMNCFLSKLRRRHEEVSLSDFEDPPQLYLYKKGRELSLPADGPDPALAVLGRMESEEVSAALQQLPEEYRTVASLYFIEDLRYQDIAELLDIPVGTVRSRLHRARRLLQVKLWKIANDNGLVPRRGPVGDDDR